MWANKEVLNNTKKFSSYQSIYDSTSQFNNFYSGTFKMYSEKNIFEYLYEAELRILPFGSSSANRWYPDKMQI